MPLADYRAEFGLRELPFYDLYGSFLNAVRTLAPKAMRPMTRSNTVRADELSVQMIYHRKPHEQLLHSGWLPNEVEYALRNGASAGPEPTLGSGKRTFGFWREDNSHPRPRTTRSSSSAVKLLRRSPRKCVPPSR